MDFCYSHEAFLPHNCSFAIYYFIISLPISLSLSLSLSLSIPFLCQNKKDWTTGDLQISLNRWRPVSSASWLSRPSASTFVRDRRIRGAAISPIDKNSRSTRFRRTRNRDLWVFFGSLFGFSLTSCHGRTSHGQPPSKSLHCNLISLSRRWIVVN